MRVFDFETGWCRECALCGSAWEDVWGGLGDGGGDIFPLPGYGGSGDGVYIGGGTNDAFTFLEPMEPAPPKSIAACRSLA